MGTLLQIDDDAASRRVFERILQRRPALQLVAADGGRAGLRLAQEHHPDLIVSDLMLPDLSGHELLVALRADPTLRHIPVVITSGEARPERIEEVMAAGATDYLTKPFSHTHLLEVIDRYTKGDAGSEDSRTDGAASIAGAPGGAEDPLAADALAQLRRLHARLAPGDTLIVDFLTDADQLIATIAAGLASGDDDAAARAAHNLSGSTGMFAADLVSGLASELEQLLVGGEVEGAEALFVELRHEMGRAADALRREFPSP